MDRRLIFPFLAASLAGSRNLLACGSRERDRQRISGEVNSIDDRGFGVLVNGRPEAVAVSGSTRFIQGRDRLAIGNLRVGDIVVVEGRRGSVAFEASVVRITTETSETQSAPRSNGGHRH
jgi:hypothetical protein